ncbi:MAG: universal stress protein [Desulfosarcinaceae bacterium]
MTLKKTSDRLILCAVDLSPASPLVVAWALALAQRTETRLCLFHAVHTPSDALHPSAEFERGGDLRQRRQNCREQMAGLMRGEQTPWQSEIVFGEPVEEMLRFCRNNDVWLIVAGCRSLKGLQRLLLGDVIERLARSAALPLFMVRDIKTTGQKIGRIGICCGPERESRAMVDLGSKLAGLFQSEIVLLHAMESAVRPLPDELPTMPYSVSQERLQDRLKSRLLDQLPAQVRALVPCRAHVAGGTARDLLPGLAAEAGLDVAVVGVRHHSIVGKLVLGSATEALLRKAPCHVLTVPVSPVGSEAARSAPPAAGRTGVVRDPLFLDHRCPSGHLESHGRLEEGIAHHAGPPCGGWC